MAGRDWRGAPPPTDHLLNNISQEFTYSEIAECTGNFSKSNRLGEGSYGTVYRGGLRDGTEVAVKALSSPKEGGFREEVEVLSRFRHPNLVILMGFARNGRERYLVYELLPGGDVNARLNKDKHFTWQQRLNVVLDAALGLSHLHGSRPQVFHRDVKTQNILMDKNGTGKVADFGLACLAHANQRSLAVQQTSGTIGYADPLYIRSGVVTEKSEVYSLGMVLLEVITGRPPALQHPNGRIEYQFGHIGGDLKRLQAMVDQRGQWAPAMVDRVGGLALKCTCENEAYRPNFVQIVTQLRQWLREDVSQQMSWQMPTPARPGAGGTPRAADGTPAADPRQQQRASGGAQAGGYNDATGASRGTPLAGTPGAADAHGRQQSQWPQQAAATPIAAGQMAAEPSSSPPRRASSPQAQAASPHRRPGESKNPFAAAADAERKRADQEQQRRGGREAQQAPAWHSPGPGAPAPVWPQPTPAASVPQQPAQQQAPQHQQQQTPQQVVQQQAPQQLPQQAAPVQQPQQMPQQQAVAPPVDHRSSEPERRSRRRSSPAHRRAEEETPLMNARVEPMYANPSPPQSASAREENMTRLMEMGYQRHLAEEAFKRNSTIEGAINWLLLRETA